MRRENQHVRVGCLNANLLARLQTVAVGHTDIENNHLRMVFHCLCNGREAISCLPNDFDLRLHLQQHFQTLPQNIMVIGEHDTDGSKIRHPLSLPFLLAVLLEAKRAEVPRP